MKKLLSLLIALCALVCLTACDPSFGKIGDFVDLSEVISVELIEYDNSSANRINSGFRSDGEKAAKKLPSLNFDKMTVLEALEEEVISNFIDEVLTIGAVTTWIHLNSPIGVCLKLNYENGDFIIISCGQHNLMCLYDESGKPLSYLLAPYSDDFKTVVNKFFVTQIE